ncbi:MAG: hypothetical protein JWN01_857 [Patescibacteria group bacterium]|nr:hypothetical protein [Patescibacteria group bacterium]
MFTPWIKRKSLKRGSKGKRLVVSGESPSLIMILSFSAVLVLVGVFVVQHSLADNERDAVMKATPTPSLSPSHTPSPTLTPQP